MKIETLKDLKEFLGKLNDTQLKQPAVLHIVESFSHPIKSAMVSTEDEYLTEDGFEPVSTYEHSDFNDPLESYEIRKAGFAYLFNE
jgi:CHAD domain-containing protein